MSSTGDAHPEHILVVDDEPGDLARICQVLTEAGYTCASATDYSEAVREFAAHGGADLIIADVALPGRSGFDLAVELGSARDLKVLFISGYSGAELLRYHGVSVTDRHFLPKPFSDEGLKQRVKEVLGGGVTVRTIAGLGSRLPA